MLRFVILCILTFFMGCQKLKTFSTSATEQTSNKNREPVISNDAINRSVASTNSKLNNRTKLQADLQTLMDGIFHSYLMGQLFLQKFDAELDKDPSSAMKSDSYSSLLSVRYFVDKFEHDINDLYMSLVFVTALPQFTPEQKANAQMSLDTIGNFMAGIKTDATQVPENLKPMILSNLIEKQTLLYEELKSINDEKSFTNDDSQIKEVLHKNMVLLRATRRSYSKELSNYKVNQDLLQRTIEEESQKKTYRDLEKEIEALSKDMKSYISQIGRGTSQDAIFPSAGPNGNISGKNFPAKTWALTFDDGPAKTTTDVLKNLKTKNVPATFFMLAKQVEAYPLTVSMLREAKMDLASHSYTHAQLTKVNSAQLEKEIATSKKVIQAKTGTAIKLFRLPYGAGVSVGHVRAKIAANNMIHVFWTVDTLDWQDKNPNSIFARTLKQMNATPKNAGVILFHDIHPQSVTASAMVMEHFNKHGLIACTVQGVVDQLNKNLSSCK